MTHGQLFAVLLGGDLVITDRLRARLAGARAIAADGGMRHARGLGLTPELWVGDFDSTPADLVAAWSHVERRPFPVGKNQTDGEIATAEAIARGAREIVLVGAFGGDRSDHAVFHLINACRLRARGVRVLVTSGLEEATPLSAGSESFDLPKGSLFSILGFSDLTEVGIAGARYPLAGFFLPFGSSRTISNIAEGPITISLGSGHAVLVAHPYDFSGA